MQWDLFLLLTAQFRQTFTHALAHVPGAAADGTDGLGFQIGLVDALRFQNPCPFPLEFQIGLAHLFDPYLAVHTSSVEPLPHQISAVYQEMLPRLPLRYVLADDPGAGKTIMTGLFIKELMARGSLKRCLIVSPGSLVEQWQDELFQKFHLHFDILTNDRIESAATGNVFNEVDLCICRLDKLARNDAIQEKLKVSEWDLIVCDEAHKMSATVWGGEVKYTRRFLLGRLLSNITKNFLLLTATPHNGKEEDFHLFLSLIDPDRFEGIHGKSQQAVDVSDVMRRLVKEELLKFDGTPTEGQDPEDLNYVVSFAYRLSNDSDTQYFRYNTETQSASITEGYSSRTNEVDTSDSEMRIVDILGDRYSDEFFVSNYIGILNENVYFKFTDSSSSIVDDDSLVPPGSYSAQVTLMIRSVG